MRRIFLIFGIIVLLLAVVGYSRSVEKKTDSNGAIAGPKMVVEPSEWSFGEIEGVGKVSKDFTIRNLGTQTLTISRVSTSCGCTTAKIDTENINPTETARLEVTYDPQAMKHERGQLERIVYLKSNDTEKPQTEIVIKVNVSD